MTLSELLDTAQADEGQIVVVISEQETAFGGVIITNPPDSPIVIDLAAIGGGNESDIPTPAVVSVTSAEVANADAALSTRITSVAGIAGVSVTSAKVQIASAAATSADAHANTVSARVVSVSAELVSLIQAVSAVASVADAHANVVSGAVVSTKGALISLMHSADAALSTRIDGVNVTSAAVASVDTHVNVVSARVVSVSAELVSLFDSIEARLSTRIDLGGGTASVTSAQVQAVSAQAHSIVSVLSDRVASVSNELVSLMDAADAVLSNRIDTLVHGFSTTSASIPAQNVLLSAGSPYEEWFTGDSFVVRMPELIKLTRGEQFLLKNNSSANIDVVSFGNDPILSIGVGLAALLTNTGTGVEATAWDYIYIPDADAVISSDIALSERITSVAGLGGASVTSAKLTSVDAHANTVSARVVSVSAELVSLLASVEGRLSTRIDTASGTGGGGSVTSAELNIVSARVVSVSAELVSLMNSADAALSLRATSADAHANTVSARVASVSAELVSLFTSVDNKLSASIQTASAAATSADAHANTVSARVVSASAELTSLMASADNRLSIRVDRARTFTVNVKEAPYSAARDGVTDDTSAIQTAITDVFNAGGGTVFFPKGTYFVNGAFDGTTNSILKIPMNASTNAVISIALVGEVHAPWITNLTASLPGGAIIKATRTGTGTRPSILAGAAHMASPGVTDFNAVFLSIKGMTFRTYDNPSIDALNLRLISRASLEDVAVDTGTQTPSQPTGGTFGIDMPATSNYAVNVCNRVAVQGYDKGIGFGEHFTSQHTIVAYCNIGVLVSGANDQGATGNIVIVWCTKFMMFVGTATVDLNLDLERAAAGPWYATSTDIDGGSNYCKGQIRYTLSDNTGLIAGPINASNTGDIMFVNLYNGQLQWNTDTGLKRDTISGGALWVTDGTSANYRDILVRGLRSKAVPFASAIASPVEGTYQAFTDSSTATQGATIAGGGANHVMGYYNGTNWIVATGSGGGAASVTSAELDVVSARVVSVSAELVSLMASADAALSSRITSVAGLGGASTTSAEIYSIVQGYSTFSIGATSVLLSAGSPPEEFATGATGGSILMPDVTTLVLGKQYLIKNNSSANVIVASSGGNTIVTVPAGNATVLTCILTTGTTAASWDYTMAGSAGVDVVSARLVSVSAELVSLFQSADAALSARITSAGGAASVTSTELSAVANASTATSSPILSNAISAVNVVSARAVSISAELMSQLASTSAVLETHAAAASARATSVSNELGSLLASTSLALANRTASVSAELMSQLASTSAALATRTASVSAELVSLLVSAVPKRAVNTANQASITVSTGLTVSGVSVALVAGQTYTFEFQIPFTAAVATGLMVAVVGPATTNYAACYQIPGAVGTTGVAPAANAVTPFMAQVRTIGTKVSTTSVTLTGVTLYAYAWGTINPSAPGSIKFVIGPNTSGAANSGIVPLQGCNVVVTRLA